MSLTYGYRPGEGDDTMAVPIEVIKTMTPLVVPGVTLVNNLPFCAVTTFVTMAALPSHSHFQ